MQETAKEAVYRVVRQIPAGKVLTYGGVAQIAGLGRAARMVGSTLRKLPPDSQLPWHRVINSQGQISLPEPALQIQRQRLESEGVVFIRGKVSLVQHMWQP